MFAKILELDIYFRKRIIILIRCNITIKYQVHSSPIAKFQLTK